MWRAVSLLVVTVGLACAEPVASEPPLPRIEPGEVQLALRLDAPASPTGRLMGWNIGRGTLYGPVGDPLHPQWRTPARVAAFETLASLRGPGDTPPLVRFSGLQIDGAIGGDGYHFWDFAEPGHPVSDDDNMAPFEYMAIVEDIGAEPLITLNFGSGTAQEAARYVRYLVGEDMADELVAARVFSGRTEPYRPVAYELGNEIYGFWNTGYSGSGSYSYANPEAIHGGDPPWHGRPASDAADYAARGLEYVAAVLAEDPVARFWVPLSQAPMDGWGGLDAALPALEPLLAHPAVQAVVVHQYQVDDATTMGLTDMEAPMLALAGSELFRPGYEQLRARLQTLRPDDPLQIAISEYHVAGAFTLGGFDAVGDTHRVGLGLADELIMFAQLGVEYAQQHMAVAFAGQADEELLFEPWYNPMVERDGVVSRRSSLVATQMVADHLMATTVPLEAAQMPQGSYEEEGGRLQYPIVHGVGFLGGDEASVVFLHRELSQARTVSVDLPAGEGWRLQGAVAYAPPDVVGPIADGPVEWVEPVVVEGLDRVRVDVPPHSLIGLRFSR